MDDNQKLNPADPDWGDARGRRPGRILLALIGLVVLLGLLIITASTAVVLLNRDGDEVTVSEPGQNVRGPDNQDSAASSTPLATTANGVAAPAVGQPAATAEPSATATTESMPEPTRQPAEEPAAESTPSPTATEPPAREITPTVYEGRIAVVDGQSRLWTMASDGSDRRLLTGPGRFYKFPSWSPAGGKIAALGNDVEGGGVYVMADVEESPIQELYLDTIMQPIYLYWAPSGDRVSFISNHPDGLALYLAPDDGREAARVVATSPSTFFWDWMPDSSQVLIHTGFTAQDNEGSRLAFVSLEEGIGPSEIAQRGHFQAPAIAANGRYYSYSDEDPAGNHWMSVHDLETDQQVKLINHQGVVAMGFSPAGSQLAFTSPGRPAPSFYGALRLINLENGEVNLLVREPVLAFFWSPDGTSIAYLTLSDVDRPFNFDDAPMAREPGHTLSRSGQPDISKTASLVRQQPPPDDEPRIGVGLSVVDIASGETRLLTVFEPGDVFLNEFLPFFDQYALSHQLWSPDSQALVLPMASRSGQDYIVVVPTVGGELQPIARGVAAFWSQQ